MRRFRRGDARLVLELDSDPEVVRYAEPELLENPPPLAAVREHTLPEMMEHNNRRDGVGFWAAFEKQSRRFCGWFMLEPRESDTLELGYRLMRRAWGQGLATEGTRGVLARVRWPDGVACIAAVVDPKNTSSIRVLEKIGLTREGFRDWYGEPEPLFILRRPARARP